MEFEWDEGKRLSNMAKHGVDFVDAMRVFDDEGRLETKDLRRDYGEMRVRAVGLFHDSLLTVVYTDRGRMRRLISARRANRNERIAYQGHHQGDR